jgi:hypothetical protein
MRAATTRQDVSVFLPLLEFPKGGLGWDLAAHGTTCTLRHLGLDDSTRNT